MFRAANRQPHSEHALACEADNTAVLHYLAEIPKRDTSGFTQPYPPVVQQLLHTLHENTEDCHADWIAQNATCAANAAPASCSLLYASAPLNYIRHINTYLREQNRLLCQEGYFVCRCYTSAIRKEALFNRYPPVVAYPVYFFDFLWNRICPKLALLKPVYYGITGGTHRVYPRPEILGRLYYCGFEIVEEIAMHGYRYIVARKIQPPSTYTHPSYGPVVRLPRVGLNGKPIIIYKLRTMHAYAEYLQHYVYAHNHLQNGGKLAKDYRIAAWAKWIRKYWIDELPMIANFLKGDIKLIGVRPLSPQYFSLYSPELQKLRIRVKPGLLPPYYADMPQNMEDIQASEQKYLNRYLKHPFKTDWQYFWKILYNILFKHKHSS